MGSTWKITLVERQSRRMFTITTIITIKSLLPLLIIGVFFFPRFLDPSLEHPDPSSGNTCTDLNPSLKDLKVKTRGPDLFIPNWASRILGHTQGWISLGNLIFCWVLHPNQVSLLGGKNMFWILFGFLLLVLRTRIPVTYRVYGKYYFIPSKESWERLKNLKIFDRITLW